MSSSLISKGLRASNFRNVIMSAMTCSSFFGLRRQGRHKKVKWMSTALPVRAREGFSPLGQQNYQHHAPDGQQRVSDCVSDGVTQSGNLALGPVVDHAERGRRGAC